MDILDPNHFLYPIIHCRIHLHITEFNRRPIVEIFHRLQGKFVTLEHYSDLCGIATWSSFIVSGRFCG